MRCLRFIGVTVLQTLLRILPFPCRTGLVRIGNPDRRSPVFLTGNFRLTVERVRWALEGIDAYLLVANSRGVNVWCAATGGLLTDHDVVSVLKTSGIESLVDHRRVILPQLAATGIEGGVIHDKTGWRVVWGPVYAKSIPAFLDAGLKATAAMRSVEFPLSQRLEMAVAWAFPMSLLSLLVLPFWEGVVLPLVGIVWALSLGIFWSFPLYQKRIGRARKHVGFVFFDFGERGVPLIAWLVFLGALAEYALLAGQLSWILMLRWGLASLVVLLILGLDLTGSTPVFKSGLHADRQLAITLDVERCTGAGFCEQVCPSRVFLVDHQRKMAALPGADDCVQCGACIVQCPFDALSFRAPGGEFVAPATIRKFKLNLLGGRRVNSARA
jgi:NAD-dependent dihydropyrimidine dehydrogenase PreA subunit